MAWTQLAIWAANVAIDMTIAYYQKKKADELAAKQRRKSALESFKNSPPQVAQEGDILPRIFGTRVVPGLCIKQNSEGLRDDFRADDVVDGKPGIRQAVFRAVRNPDLWDKTFIFKAVTGFVLAHEVDRIVGMSQDASRKSRTRWFSWGPNSTTTGSNAGRASTGPQVSWPVEDGFLLADWRRSPTETANYDKRILYAIWENAGWNNNEIDYKVYPCYGQDFPGGTPTPQPHQFASSSNVLQLDTVPESNEYAALFYTFGWTHLTNPQAPTRMFEVYRRPQTGVAALDLLSEIPLTRSWLEDAAIWQGPQNNLTTTTIGRLPSMSAPAANPACIVYEFLTNPDWGMAVLPSFIDEISFEEAAQRLMTDHEGYDLAYTSDSPKTMVEKLVDAMDGVLYVSRLTGLVTLKLFRPGDTVVGTLDDQGIVNFQDISRDAITVTPNKLEFKYSKVGGGLRNLRYENPDIIEAAGQEIGIESAYEFITEPEVASLVGVRKYVVLCANPLRARIDVPTGIAAGWEIGSLIQVTSQRMGLEDYPFRIVAISESPEGKGTVTLTLLENLWDTEASTYYRGTDAQVANGYAAEDVEDFKPYEISSWEMYWSRPDAVISAQEWGIDNTEAAQLAVLASPQNVGQLGFQLLTAYDPLPGLPGLSSYTLQSTTTNGDAYARKFFLANDLDHIQDEVLFDDDPQLVTNSVVLIDDELMQVVGRTQFGYRMNRGCHDTACATHNADARIWVLYEGGFRRQSENNPKTGKLAADPYTYKLQSFAKLGPEFSPVFQPLLDAVTANYNFKPYANGPEICSRQCRPYLPTNLRAEGSLFPSDIPGPTFTLTWTEKGDPRRSFISGAPDEIDKEEFVSDFFTDQGFSNAPGIHNVRVQIVDSGGSLFYDNSFTFSSGTALIDFTGRPAGDYILRVWSQYTPTSILSVIDSHQVYEWTASLNSSAPTSGWDFDWDNNWSN